MSKCKRLASLVCALSMMMAACTLPASAAEQTTVDPTVAKHFPEGIPDYLTDSQVQTVLAGEYLSLIIDEEVIVYNPEKSPSASLGRAAETVWEGANFLQGATYWPEHARLEYVSANWGNEIKASTKYFIGNQDPDVSSGERKGRAWCMIRLKNGNESQKQDERLYRGDQFFSDYVLAKVSITRTADVEFLRYAYRNLREDWSKAYRVVE